MLQGHGAHNLQICAEPPGKEQHLQHGFRSGHSYESQLSSMLHDLTCNLDLNKQTDVAILDFSKAFDTVPHKRLLLKLKHYGISGWIKSFLVDRHRHVIVEGESSTRSKVLSGVPQQPFHLIGPHNEICMTLDPLGKNTA